MVDVHAFVAAFWHMETYPMLRWNWHSRMRHPLARLFALAVGAIAVVVVLAFGLAIGGALVVGGAIVLLIKALSAPSKTTAPPPRAEPASTRATDHVIEGEFTVARGAPRQSATSTR
jgi:hypothetical protein